MLSAAVPYSLSPKAMSLYWVIIATTALILTTGECWDQCNRFIVLCLQFWKFSFQTTYQLSLSNKYSFHISGGHFLWKTFLEGQFCVTGPLQKSQTPSMNQMQLKVCLDFLDIFSASQQMPFNRWGWLQRFVH